LDKLVEGKGTEWSKAARREGHLPELANQEKLYCPAIRPPDPSQSHGDTWKEGAKGGIDRPCNWPALLSSEQSSVQRRRAINVLEL